MNEEKLLILPLNDGTAKRISLALANETSRKVLEALAEESLSAGQISEKLGVPLTTLHYNIENLIEVGLIKVERTRYSEKGREVKVYAPTRKYIVIAPENVGKEEIRSTLKKFLFGAYFLLGSVFSGYAFQKLYYRFSAPQTMPRYASMATEKVAESGAPVAPAAAEKAAASGTPPATTPMMTPAPSQASPELTTQIPEPNAYLWFAFGAIFALALLFVWRKVAEKE